MTRWTDDLLAECKRLFIHEGLSARDTAELLGQDITRNMVCGVAHRNGWDRDPEIAAQNAAAGRKAMVRKAPPPKAPRPPKQGRRRKTRLEPTMPLPSPPTINSKPRPWITRKRGECAWPIGEPARPSEQLSCCAPAENTYCPGHLHERAATGLYGVLGVSSKELYRSLRRHLG